MNYERINAALRDATDTHNVTIGARVLTSVDDVLGESFGDQPAVVVADGNTFAAAGKEVQQHLEAAGRRLLEPYIFPGQPTLYADYKNIQTLIEALLAHDAIPVAVGSGTLNDIVKRAVYECERPYLNVATAASMEGYTAFGASITKDGHKQTLTCPAPRAVLTDLDVLVNAPARMTASGYADLLGKVTAGADWLIADALEVEKIDPQVWSLVQDPLRGWTGAPAELRDGDQEAMNRLIEGLIVSGLAMQVHRSSRPASGSEHQFSHLWEMEGLGRDDNPPLSHGFKVGVGSVAIAALYERILQRDLGDLDIEALHNAWPTQEEVQQTVRAAHTTPGLDEAAVKESLAKYINADQLAQRLELLRERWPELRERVAAQLMTADQLRSMLQAAGCPTRPSEVGLGWKAFKGTYSRAQMIRRRYTVLDLATETGILAECVDELFAPGGFWARDVAPWAGDRAYLVDDKGKRLGAEGGSRARRSDQEQHVDAPGGKQR
jgi:glycerol-1-phosphate dehydrogenase [NAD(P)+]